MFYEINTAGYILRIRVTPNSSRCSAGGIFTDSNNCDFLKINLTTVPEKGKANQDLIKYLSKLLHISKSNFTIITGQTDRYKKIELKTEHSTLIETALNQLEQNHDSTNN